MLFSFKWVNSVILKIFFENVTGVTLQKKLFSCTSVMILFASLWNVFHEVKSIQNI